MVESLKSFIAKNKLIAPKSRIVLAISGGVDSMVMADLFRNLGQHIGIAHVNHGLRAAASDEDQNFVASYCKEHGIAFHCVTLDLSHLKEQGGNMHAESRDLRYRFFEELCEEHGYDAIATAHHLDDNIETLFLRLCRGTGVKGMTGIPIRRGRIIRPLLFTSKEEILAYAQKKKLQYREDASNSEDVYDRNFLRNTILPQLNTRFPQLQKRNSNSLENFNAENSLLDLLLQEKKDALLNKKDGHIYVEKSLLKPYLDSPIFVFKLLEEFGFTKSQSEDLLEAFDQTSKQFITQTHTLTVERETLVIQEIQTSDDLHIQLDSFPRTVRFSSDHDLEFEVTPNKDILFSDYLAVWDKEKLQEPLVISPWQTGESFKPFGMQGKSQKIKDFLVHVKHPSHAKKDCLVLRSDSKIAWVIPYRISQEFCVDENTKEVIVVKKKLIAN